MAVNCGKLDFLAALWRGRARKPFGVRLFGTAGKRRDATHGEVQRIMRRMRRLRFLRGHQLLWGKLRTVRDISFHAFEPVRLAPLGDSWTISATRLSSSAEPVLPFQSNGGK
jgi:hypothetical protein